MPALTPATPTEQEFQQLSEMYVRVCLHGADLKKRVDMAEQERDQWRGRVERMADAIRAAMRQALDDHTLCADEGTPNERIVRPSLQWFVEDYLPKVMPEAFGQAPRTENDTPPLLARFPGARYIDRHGEEWVIGDNGLMHHHSYSQRSMDTLEREYGPLRRTA